MQPQRRSLSQRPPPRPGARRLERADLDLIRAVVGNDDVPGCIYGADCRLLPAGSNVYVISETGTLTKSRLP